MLTFIGSRGHWANGCPLRWDDGGSCLQAF